MKQLHKHIRLFHLRMGSLYDTKATIKQTDTAWRRLFPMRKYMDNILPIVERELKTKLD